MIPVACPITLTVCRWLNFPLCSIVLVTLLRSKSGILHHSPFATRPPLLLSYPLSSHNSPLMATFRTTWTLLSGGNAADAGLRCRYSPYSSMRLRE